MYPVEVMEAITKSIPTALEHARRGLPEEVVGLTLSDGSIVPLINQARSGKRFEVSVAQMASAFASIDPDLYTIYALYHSHPESSLNLSPADQYNMRVHWNVGGLRLPWVVISPESGEARLWWLDDQFDMPTHYDLPVVVNA